MKQFVESEVYVDPQGYAHDDEGNVWKTGRGSGVYSGSEFHPPDRTYRARRHVDFNTQLQLVALEKALKARPGDRFLTDIRRQLEKGHRLSDKQKQVVRQIFYKIRMKPEADYFRESKETGMRALLERLERMATSRGCTITRPRVRLGEPGITSSTENPGRTSRGPTNSSRKLRRTFRTCRKRL